MFPRLTSRDAAVLVVSLLAIAVATVGLRQLPDVSPTTVALAFLLIVLAAATTAPLAVAIVVSIVSMASFNFYFLPPVGALTIADPQNWIALFAFLIVAVIASNLSAAAQARAREAIARRNEVTRLFDLTRDVLLTTETGRAMEVLARHVARRFELAQHRHLPARRPRLAHLPGRQRRRRDRRRSRSTWRSPRRAARSSSTRTSAPTAATCASAISRPA